VVTFHGEKVGLRITPGASHAPGVEVVDIGLEPLETRNAFVADDLILNRVPVRGDHDNKYTAGSVLVVGGSHGMTGAAALCARAAFRADAGYVAIAAPAESIPILETLVLEAVKRPLDEVFDAVGRAETDLPAVVDADALFGLQPFRRTAPTVLTPHSGELGRLLGVESRWVDEHRLEALERAVERFDCVVVLKGSGTLVGAPGQGALVCRGWRTLATAGTGDVLGGIVGSFLSKRMDARLAAAAAVTAHTEAARRVDQQEGLVASDVVEALPRVLHASV